MRLLVLIAAAFALALPASAKADTVHDALEAYALYQQDVGLLLDLEVEGARDINSAVTRLARHDPARVARGYIAYGALIAAQSPAFVAGVERRVRADGRDTVLQQLRADPTYARRQASGSPQAIRLILNSASSDGARASAAGARFEAIARSANGAWPASSGRGGFTRASARLTPETRDRLRIGALDAQPQRDAEAFGGGRFWDALAGREAQAPRTRGRREQNGYAGVTDRMLTLGALVAAGAADGERTRAAALLNEPVTESCLSMQKLQLRQCLSVSVDATERTYCLGRHGLSGPGSCFSAMAR